jgi:hypothetical protein
MKHFDMISLFLTITTNPFYFLKNDVYPTFFPSPL